LLTAASTPETASNIGRKEDGGSFRAENVKQRGSLALCVRTRQYMAAQTKEFLAGRGVKPSVRLFQGWQRDMCELEQTLIVGASPTINVIYIQAGAIDGVFFGGFI
jgi:hypothetical protein